MGKPFHLQVLLALHVLFRHAEAHGSMGVPRPRNNDPTKKTVNYGIKLRTIDGGVAWDDFNVHDCLGGYQTAAELPWESCTEYAHHHRQLAYRVSRVQPSAGSTVDCTTNNDCRVAPRPAWSGDQLDSSALWLSTYGVRDCAATPLVTYKIKSDTCTQFPVNGEDYWTGGCEGFACMWFSQGCTIGCTNCTGDTKHPFGNLCGSTKQPTLADPSLRTFNRRGRDPLGDWTKYHPWRAPGSAPVLDACGVAGGFRRNNEGPGGHPPPGHNWGDRGSELPAAEAKARWTVGSTVRVSWGIAANHGGGYQYRLCPKSEQLTEECFQRTPLPFAGSRQILLLGNGTSVEIEATRVSSGTVPEGSTWTMNPVPACGDAVPGTYGRPCTFPQFPPPPGCDETCWGDSDETLRAGHRHAVTPQIVDLLQLPAALAPGDYVLGWRWDCEQTPQVWSSCSDVAIVAGDDLIV